jgi:hypothetical protein
VQEMEDAVPGATQFDDRVGLPLVFDANADA